MDGFGLSRLGDLTRFSIALIPPRPLLLKLLLLLLLVRHCVAPLSVPLLLQLILLVRVSTVENRIRVRVRVWGGIAPRPVPDSDSRRVSPSEIHPRDRVQEGNEIRKLI